MLYSTATTIFLCLSSTLLVIAAPIPIGLSARASKKSSSKDSPNKDGGGGGLIFPASVNDDGQAFGIAGKFKKIKTAEIRQDGDSAVLVAKYPEGSYAGSKPPGPGIAGFIFDGDGGADLSNAQEAVLNYEVKFPEGFDFALAGKIPGLYGGDNLQVAGTCAGGNHDDKCWSARLMWREKGKGELYGYIPSANQKTAPVCQGKDICSVKYGASIGTGKWTFTPGKWTKLTERVKLNDIGQNNAEIEVSVDGESKILVNKLQLSTSKASRIRGIMIHTFFGGSSSPNFASPKNQEALFRNFNLKVTKTFGSSGGEGDKDA